MLQFISSQLASLGFKSAQLQQLVQAGEQRFPWRIASVNRGACEVVGVAAGDSTGVQEVMTQSVSVPPGLQPVVGDWALLQEQPGAPAALDVVLERQTWLRRTAVGSSNAQYIASNLDTVFVVAGCASVAKANERALNPRRLERLIWVAREGGAEPIVLLNKADLIAERESVARALSRRLGGVQVRALSAQSGEGIAELEPELQPGCTVALIGPSGVGKSTLTNRLLGEERQRTTFIRDSDGKGRHTTTRRELFIAQHGALLIDTPGMREVSLFSEEGEAQGFDDIESLAERCRFTDCGHHDEPGCEVRFAIARGDCDLERLESYFSLKRDAARQATRHDAQARHEMNRQVRRFGRMVREHQRIKGR